MAQYSHSTQASSGIPVVGGIIGGASAYLVGFLAILFAKSGAIQNDLTQTLGQIGQLSSDVTLPEAWQVGGWVFYAAHNVEITMDLSTAGQSISRSLPVTNGLLWEPWFLVVPIVALLIAGFIVAWTAPVQTAASGFQAGASVVLGYGSLAIGGVFLTEWGLSISQLGTEVTASVGPSLVPGVVLVGLVYPIIGGGIGGIAASRT
ncbi:hypothetical protein [Halorhabdus sp. CUG00001]|uniref:hypothetical protein n=1 Tax=Halorhabdus sp. CUG00001 TaxID=2600297 RepID=UPI00131AA3F2|nr:hypothetical protein [Halorhabdus sp. CUG00001]